MSNINNLRKHVVATPEAMAADEQRKAQRRARIRARMAQEPRKSEVQEQVAFIAWARRRGLLCWHTPNENSSVRRAVKLKRLGQLAGVADLIVARHWGPPVALEFKSATGRLSEAQSAWSEAVRYHGWEYRVVRSCEEAQRVCLDLGL